MEVKGERARPAIAYVGEKKIPNHGSTQTKHWSQLSGGKKSRPCAQFYSRVTKSKYIHMNQFDRNSGRKSKHMYVRHGKSGGVTIGSRMVTN